MSTWTHNGTVFRYKAYKDVYWQWEQYQVPNANLEPSISTTFPDVNLNGCQKHSGKAGQLKLANGGSEQA